MIEVYDSNELVEVKQTNELAQVMPLEKMFELAQMLAKSTIVPTQYQNRAENCYIAIEMAQRTGMPVMAIMQNLYVIQGKPSWSGQAIASMIRNSNQFKDVELHFVGQENTDSWGAYVTATRVSNGQKLKGGTVTILTAKKEGWYSKSGSKWITMPELMLSYRAYAWFGRVYSPELMMGLQSREEVEDVVEKDIASKPLDVFESGV